MPTNQGQRVSTLADEPTTLQREVKLPGFVMKLLKGMGVAIPDNFKEIDAEVIASDEVKQIIIPKSMTKLEASKELERQHKNEEQFIDVVTDFPGWNWKDVLIAIKRTTEQVFGWINGRPTWFTNPTEMDVVVDIKNGKHVIEKAFFNGFNIGPWENATGNVWIRNGEAGVSLNIKKKYSEEATQYFNAIRQQLETKSIYRGRNIAVQMDKNKNLEFEIFENKASDIIVLNHATQLVVDNFIIGALPDGGKRTFLLTGDYGNGKTEIASAVGRIGVQQHGQSFFYVKDSSLFEKLLLQSKKYQPCIIFLEDIDEIAGGEQRDNAMNSILNTLDGVQTKGNNLITIFTTNHPERINSALRRPGRIDLIVEFKNPDIEAKEIIMRRYFEHLDGADEVDYRGMAEFMPDVQGAVIAEICKRAVKLTGTKNNRITDDIIMASIESIKFQVQLMRGESSLKNEYETFFTLFKKFAGMEEIKTLAAEALEHVS